MSRKAKAEAFVDEGYNITISGRHVLVTDSMKDYAIEKISKLEKLSPRLIDVNVTMDIQKTEHRVDMVMRFNNEVFKSHSASSDMYASIDKAVEKLHTQILRFKSRIQDHHAQGTKDVDMNVNVVRPRRDDDLHAVNDEIEEINESELINFYRPHQIVAQEKIPLKYLTISEAIKKMDSSADTFLIYRGEEDRKIKVIYRRKDGNYGVIEPEL